MADCVVLVDLPCLAAALLLLAGFRSGLLGRSFFSFETSRSADDDNQR